MAKTSEQIRREFLEFFEQRGHTVVPSSPLLPADDPTLLFANAGMNQFKDVFLGTGSRPYRRAVDSQKCIRAGGKHNDLEDVGRDTCHHTFFEMLGNWSFGDYFKPEAIRWAWELLTEVWSLPRERLWVTVFGGDEASGLAADAESASLWSRIAAVAPERVLPGGIKDNFWEMGDTGPCGPCTEVHIDLGEAACDGSRHRERACGVNVEGCGRFIELWNLVFIQSNRSEGGALEPLPARHVDTGMGFERICAVLQGTTDNYGSDVFAPLMDWLTERSGLRYGDRSETDVAFRVVADHARACSFAIADGVLPSNEGRGYVIRRILRRAARFGRKLAQHEPFLHLLVPVIAEQMGAVFPETARRGKQVAETIRQEEEAFNRTLDRGLEIFERAAAEARRQIGGDVAFELYATYGFPIDLTRQMARERGLQVDFEGFEAQMERHRETSSVKGGPVTAGYMQPRPTEFVGYDKLEEDSRVIDSLRLERGKSGKPRVSGSALNEGDEGIIFLDLSPFYAEAGGQVGDTGVIEQPTGTFRVTETRKEQWSPALRPNYCHFGKVEQGSVQVHVSGARIGPAPPVLPIPGRATARVDAERRMDIRRNHTATHLLNWALGKVLGDHVEQAGSVVEPARLRFDFTHNAAVTDEQLREVEGLVNDRILADEPVRAEVMPLPEARKIRGVRAVFGEKYPDPVRVIRIGAAEGGSAEFCGGTHLERTAQAGFFKIVSEESVARGVRRITAVTGHEAVRHVQRLAAAARSAATALRVPVEQIGERVEALQKELKALRKRPAGGAGAFQPDFVVQTPQGKALIGQVASGDPAAMRTLCDVQRQKGAAAMLVGAAGEGKVTLIAVVTEELAKGGKVRADAWVRAAAAVVGGGGGGKPTMAQAGGKDPARLPAALEAGRDWLQRKVAEVD